MLISAQLSEIFTNLGLNVSIKIGAFNIDVFRPLFSLSHSKSSQYSKEYIIPTPCFRFPFPPLLKWYKQLSTMQMETTWLKRGAYLHFYLMKLFHSFWIIYIPLRRGWSHIPAECSNWQAGKLFCSTSGSSVIQSFPGKWDRRRWETPILEYLISGTPRQLGFSQNKIQNLTPSHPINHWIAPLTIQQLCLSYRLATLWVYPGKTALEILVLLIKLRFRQDLGTSLFNANRIKLLCMLGLSG